MLLHVHYSNKLILKRSFCQFCQNQALMCSRIQCCLHLSQFFTSLWVPGTSMLTVGSQLWLLVTSQLASHCVCSSHTALCEWSCSLLGPVTYSRRLWSGGRRTSGRSAVVVWSEVGASTFKTRYWLPPHKKCIRYVAGGGGGRAKLPLLGDSPLYIVT